MTPQHYLMVVEDDPQVRDALVDLLEDSGHRVVAAVNGLDALNRLKAATDLPCLILLDLMMPVMDGIAFRAAQLAETRLASIPVVVLSAFRDVDAQADTLKALRYLKKPPRHEELVSVIQANC